MPKPLESPFKGLFNGCLIAFPLGIAILLMEPTPLLFLLLGVGAIAWLLYSIKTPAASFLVTFFTWVSVYSRLQVPIADVEGPGNRGTLSLGDILWFGTFAAICLRFLLKGRISRKSTLPIPLLLLLPYVLVSIVLPTVGVIVGHWPISYAIPAFRHIQWASFVFMTYRLARLYAPEQLFQGLFHTGVVATLIHALYSVVQLGAYLKALPRNWLWLDDFFVSKSAVAWFYYPRTTGLLVNPNSYGLLGSLMFILAFSVWFTNLTSIIPRLPIGMAVLAALWALASSGSRSALLGLIFAGLFFALALVLTLNTRWGPFLAARGLNVFLIGLPVLTSVLAMMVSLLPDVLVERVALLWDVIRIGVEADPNAIGRIDMWSQALREQWQNYPFGTLVPPSYALWSAIDSYYIVTWTQGTPLYTGLFVLALYGCVMLALFLMMKGKSFVAAIGLSVLGATGVVVGASFTLSPLLQPHISALFWSLVGVGFAARRGIYGQ